MDKAHTEVPLAGEAEAPLAGAVDVPLAGEGAPRPADESGWIRPYDLAVVVGAGAAGLAAMAPILAFAWVVGALPADAFAGLARIVGAGSNLTFGLVLFLAGGVTTIPLLFAALAGFLPPERNVALRGAVYAAVVWTGFAMAFYEGQAGIELAAYLALTLLAHLAYGYVVGAAFDRYGDVSAPAV